MGEVRNERDVVWKLCSEEISFDVLGVAKVVDINIDVQEIV